MKMIKANKSSDANGVITYIEHLASTYINGTGNGKLCATYTGGMTSKEEEWWYPS